MQDISYVIGVLHNLLSLVVLASVAFIYASFFSKMFAAKTTQLWSTFTALGMYVSAHYRKTTAHTTLGFAIGGTVIEFLACEIYIFIKHPYDIGDRVDIDRVQLIVERVSLMYSIFRRIDSDKTVQIPHKVANSPWIEDVSRSRLMKEQYNFSDEPLRQTRRNKFMVAPLKAIRAVPINAPGTAGPALGDPANPSYVVKVSDQKASTFRTAHKEDLEAKRLFPTGTTLRSFLPEGISSAFEPATPASAVGPATVTGRRGSSGNRGG
jgi:hypothetical protein